MMIDRKIEVLPEEFEEVVSSSIISKDLEDMKKFKKVLSWILVSSANGQKISLTLKAGIPFLVLLGIGDTELLGQLAGTIGTFLVNLGQIVSGLVTAYGLMRKMVNLYK